MRTNPAAQPVTYFDGRPYYDHPAFPGGYQPAIYQNAGPAQLRQAAVRSAGQIHTGFSSFSFPYFATFPYPTFLSRAGYACDRWLSLSLEQKRTEVAAVLLQGRTIYEVAAYGPIPALQYPSTAIGDVDNVVQRIDAICVSGGYSYGISSYGYPYLSSWPFIRVGTFENGPRSKGGSKPAGRAIRPAGWVNPSGQVVATSAGADLLTGLLGLAISFGVVYAGAYYGAKAAGRR